MTDTTSLTYRLLIRRVADRLRQARTENSEFMPASLSVQALEDMKESVVDLPVWQVYPDSGETDMAGNRVNQSSFSGNVKQTDVVLFADLLTRQRSDIGEDMASVVDGLDAATDLLDNMKSPFFDTPEIKALQWNWKRVTFNYGDAQLPYVGIRFTLTLTFF